MFKDILQRGKCLVGFHQGPWQFSAEKICTKVQICTACRARTEKPEHNWTDWDRPRTDGCDFLRQCSRCGITETKTEHVWGEPAYAAPAACALHRVCSRCAATEQAGTRHVMDTWVYAAEGACVQKNACSRCGTTGMQTRTEHAWNPPVESAYYRATVTVCGRCGEMRVPADSVVSLQQAANAVRAMTAAADRASFDASVRQHSTVLTAPATQHYLKLATDRFALESGAREKLAAAGRFTAACAQVGVEAALSCAAPQAPAPAPAAGARDQRLIGHWRHTESMSSSGFSNTTDTHLVMDADGSAVSWSHSAGSLGEQRSAKESGTWRTAGSTLYVDAGLSYSGGYQTEGGQLLWSEARRYRFWTKVR